MTARKFIPLKALAICFFFACGSNTVPSTIIQPDSMQTLLVDIHLAQATVSNAVLPIVQHNQRMVDYSEAIYKKHGTDSANFRKSWEWYSQHPDFYEKVQEKVVEKMNEMAMGK
ncbi:MAG: DUF4296 domain-containing protein [Flavobacteriaceae bacterium]|nr:DUF4296 domain-containing protein [Flavobacteriaceae bacterium]